MTDSSAVETPLAVVIADDDIRVRASLADLIDDDPRFHMIGAGASGDEAAALCAVHHPALAVVDVVMPQGGTAAIAAILAVSPTTQIMAFTARADRRMRERLLESGAGIVVAKGSDTDIAAALYTLVQSPTVPDSSATQPERRPPRQ